MTESNFDFYHRSAAVDRKSIAYRNKDLTDSIPDVDKLARFVICRNRFVA